MEYKQSEKVRSQIALTLGRHLNAPVKGINIIRSADDSTRKVLMK